ncbi:hypothetical protein B0H10DRAFT_2197652 [Mycena sp. CBHHK59/15]|nr:hypothetical protein B0H10DRAFT_2197652 [Mycena sp. CBHHK59/15]
MTNLRTARTALRRHFMRSAQRDITAKVDVGWNKNTSPLSGISHQPESDLEFMRDANPARETVRGIVGARGSSNPCAVPQPVVNVAQCNASNAPATAAPRRPSAAAEIALPPGARRRAETHTRRDARWMGSGDEGWREARAGRWDAERNANASGGGREGGKGGREERRAGAGRWTHAKTAARLSTGRTDGRGTRGIGDEGARAEARTNGGTKEIDGDRACACESHARTIPARPARDACRRPPAPLRRARGSRGRAGGARTPAEGSGARQRRHDGGGGRRGAGVCASDVGRGGTAARTGVRDARWSWKARQGGKEHNGGGAQGDTEGGAAGVRDVVDTRGGRMEGRRAGVEEERSQDETRCRGAAGGDGRGQEGKGDDDGVVRRHADEGPPPDGRGRGGRVADALPAKRLTLSSAPCYAEEARAQSPVRVSTRAAPSAHARLWDGLGIRPAAARGHVAYSHVEGNTKDKRGGGRKRKREKKSRKGKEEEEGEVTMSKMIYRKRGIELNEREQLTCRKRHAERERRRRLAIHFRSPTAADGQMAQRQTRTRGDTQERGRGVGFCRSTAASSAVLLLRLVPAARGFSIREYV